MDYQTFLSYSFLGNTIYAYLQALNIFLAVWIVLFLLHKIVSQKIIDIFGASTKLSGLIAVVLSRLGSPLFVVCGLNLVVLAINLSLWLVRSIWIGSIIVLMFYSLDIIKGAAEFLIRHLSSKNDAITDSKQKSVFHLVSLLGQILIWLIGITAVLQILEFDLTALVGTLGIGGIAIAFALQSILSDIFASFSIYLDQPFGVGDFIQLGTDSGTVEKIGIKSTRIKTLQGEMMIIPNKELTGVRIQNFSHLQRRRRLFKFGVELQTSNLKLRGIPKAIEQIIEFQVDCDFGRCNFIEIGDHSLVFEVAYFVDTADYNAYLKIQEKVNLELKEYLEKHHINLAYPVQEIILRK